MSKLNKRSNDLYNSLTFAFNDAKIQQEFDEYLMQKPIDPGVLRGEFIYNALALPAFLCFHYYQHVILKQPYVLATYAFFFAVIFVHICFFTLYVLEPSSATVTKDEKQTITNRYHGTLRMTVISVFIIASLCACGLLLHGKTNFMCELLLLDHFSSTL